VTNGLILAAAALALAGVSFFLNLNTGSAPFKRFTFYVLVLSFSFGAVVFFLTAWRELR
jgi:hypothetical protein